MKPTVFSLITLLLLLHRNFPSANTITLLEDVCKKAEVPPYATFDFCMKSMQSDPSSRTADTRGLFFLALGLANSYITSNMYNMLRLSDDQDLALVARQTMVRCYNGYGEAITNLVGVAKEVNLRRHDPSGKRLLAKVLLHVSYCVDALNQIKDDVDTVVIHDNTDALALTQITDKMYDLIK